MNNYTQANRIIEVRTQLPYDDLLLERFWGQEAISSLFSFHLDLLAKNTTNIPFDQLIGQEATVAVRLPRDDNPNSSQNNEPYRYFSGIINRFSQGARGPIFTTYHAELVPKLWLLTRTAQSRIFKMKSTVPEILEKVLETLKPEYKWEGEFEPRDYCVQYRETDFNFASRLMEEEGIFYYFKHLPGSKERSPGSHQMVVTNKAQLHQPIDKPDEVVYITVEGAPTRPNQIYDWTKTQELRSSRYRLWDYTFQLPWKNLEGKADTIEKEQVGSVPHMLKLGANANSEIYDFPGEYAQRFDAIDESGKEHNDELKKITTDNVDKKIKADNMRTAEIRMQAEALQSLQIRGSSTCPQFLPGHTFTLRQHFNANGDYLLTSVEHFGSVGSAYRSGPSQALGYQNTFSCVPSKLAFRPLRLTPKPIIYGTQSGYVVGPADTEIFTDKYGRVKVQFHWDRTGKYDAESACWIRVAQVWAGKRWGASFWPRIGQEVIVAFEEGDPDQPIIVGSVYNPDQMPPYLGDGPDPKHKNDNKVSGIKSNTTPGGQGYNEIRFDDTKDKQQVFLHSERNLEMTTKNESLARTYGNRHQIIGYEKDGKKGGDQREMVYQDKHVKIHRNQIEHIGDSMQLLVGGVDSGQGNQDLVIKGTKKESIEKDYSLKVTGGRKENIGGGQSLTVGGNQQEKVGQNHAVDAGQEIHLKAGMKIIIEAGMQISLKGPGGFVDIGPAGVTIQGTMVMINSGGSAGSGSGSSPDSPDAPTEANPTQPGYADDSKSGQKSTRSQAQ